jgi:NADH/NAD ratio-sensing transcriptional regulator Rex
VPTAKLDAPKGKNPLLSAAGRKGAAVIKAMAFERLSLYIPKIKAMLLRDASNLEIANRLKIKEATIRRWLRENAELRALSETRTGRNWKTKLAEARFKAREGAIRADAKTLTPYGLGQRYGFNTETLQRLLAEAK